MSYKLNAWYLRCPRCCQPAQRFDIGSKVTFQIVLIDLSKSQKVRLSELLKNPLVTTRFLLIDLSKSQKVSLSELLS